MKKFKLLSLLLTILLLISLLPVPALAAPPAPDIAAPYAVVMDAAAGTVLYEKSGNVSFNPSDAAVLMTALLVAEAIDAQSIALTSEVIASTTFRNELYEGAPSAVPPLVTDESLSVEELLYIALMSNAADACNVLAEYSYGSVSSFVSAMNSKAAELGCTGTRFDNPSGLGSGQISTAQDLALIARALASHSQVARICGAYQHTVASTAFSEARSLTSPNALLVADSGFYNDRVTGLRAAGDWNTGYTVVTTALDDATNISLIVVVGGSADPEQRYRDTKALLDWAFGSYSYRPLLSATDILATLPVSLGSPANVGVRPETALTLLLPNDQQMGDVQYAITYDHEQSGATLQAPINAGQVLGTVTVTMDGVEYGTSRLLAASSIEISRVEYLRTQLDQLTHAPAVRQILIILAILLVIYLLLIIFYFIQRWRHLRSVRIAKKDRAIAQTQQAVEWLNIPEEERQGYLDEEYDDYDEESEE